MPLPRSRARELVTSRKITAEGYLRDDGLMDIEGHLVDVRGYDLNNEWRGTVKQGDPAHEMWVRLTLDDALVIREVAGGRALRTRRAGRSCQTSSASSGSTSAEDSRSRCASASVARKAARTSSR
jgi:hypothetical protein